MNFIENFIWIADQAFHFSWFALALIILMLWAFWKDRKTINFKKLPLLGAPLLGVVFIIFCGSFYARQPEFSSLPLLGLIITLCLSIIVTFQFRGGRFFAGATTALILWYAFWVAFISGMSIVDDWI